MTYHYELLGPERFQQFCQALLVSLFPTVQCLPVGQPDGGRDAFVNEYLLLESERSPRPRQSIIFQVKFSRSSADWKDEREFLKDVIDSELPKVKRLIDKGATQYYLLTNVIGTSHPDRGSIDKINAHLTERLGIESYCWWRNDLDGRVDSNADLKWSYPEILKATDLLQTLLEGRLGEEEQRRKSAIKAFVTGQYDKDKDLKFKQVELESRIADLFVDLPLGIIRREEPYETARRRIRSRRSRSDYGYLDHGGAADLAANFFLNSSSLADLNRTVVEGAPGQGKSTITQYICQVLRMKLLGRSRDLEKIPENLRSASVRMPFRVDLRDFAKWMGGADPFQPKPSELPPGETRSLEAFLAALVRSASGGHSFSVSDLAAVVRSSPVLLALDGFDEVADASARTLLVQEIGRGVKRLDDLGEYRLQVIVTSRPAAFAKSPGFPKDEWMYVELLSLEGPQVDQYTDRWLKARNIHSSEKRNFKSILSQKLKEQHTQFLAKNPMQLTILLTLINIRGSSLPEKRTSMYDSYMELFFNREAEKSDIVQEYRDLLIDIHRYLAWKLQTSAESGGNGSIERDDLRNCLRDYLTSEGEPTAIVEALFDGVIERVGALVSRVQGAYEFEVQPLREYFAAKFLYDTAPPYGNASAERSGDRLDRFNALAQNPYWLNVLRFYSGCFLKGEVSALVDELYGLDNKAPYNLTSQTENLGLMLLRDWVFTQYQPAAKRVVDLLSSDNNLRFLLARVNHSESSLSIPLPDRCGRAELVSTLKSRFVYSSNYDEARAVGSALVANMEFEERFVWWMSLDNGSSVATWNRLGEYLQIFTDADSEYLLNNLPAPLDQFTIPLLRSGKFDLLCSTTALADAAVSEITANSPVPLYLPHTDTSVSSMLARLATMLSISKLGLAFRVDAGQPLRQAMSMHFGPIFAPGTLPKEGASADLAERYRPAQIAFEEFIDTSVEILISDLQPWSKYISAMWELFGDTKSLSLLSLMAAGVRVDGSVGDGPSLSDNSIGVLPRVRYARLKSGSAAWWKQELDSARDAKDLWLVLTSLWCWGTPRTIILLHEQIQRTLDNLDSGQWEELVFDYDRISTRRIHSNHVKELKKEWRDVLAKSSSRYLVFIGKTLEDSAQAIILSRYLSSYDGNDRQVWSFIVDVALETIAKSSDWNGALAYIRKAYQHNVSGYFPAEARRRRVPIDVAKEVCDSPQLYPLWLVAESDDVLLSSIGSKAAKLADLAAKNGWFAQPA